MAVKITTSIEGARLKQISQYEEMLTDDYLSNRKIEQTAFIYEKFFKGGVEWEREKKLALLNISYSLPLLIAEKFADYTGSPISPLDLNIFQNIMPFSWAGYSVFKCRQVESKFVVDYHSPDGYIRNDDGTEVLLTYMAQEINDKIERYVLTQTYSEGFIENNLYKLEASVTVGNSALEGMPIPLESLDATKHLIDKETTGLDINPIVVVHNTKISGRRYGDSDIKKVRSLISSIEVQAVNIQDQLLKHLQAKLAVPVSKMPVDKKGFVDMSKLEVIGMEAGDTAPMYLTNTNPLIEKSFENIENYIIQISAILSIPVEFFGIETSGGNESKDAKLIRLSPFLKKIDRIRGAFEKGLNEIIEIAKKWNVKIDDNFKIVWPEVFPADMEALANELVVAKTGGIISQIKAIMRYQNISEEDAEEELKLIREDNATIDADALGI